MLQPPPTFLVCLPCQINFTSNSEELLFKIKGINGNPSSGETITRFDVDFTGLISYPRIFETGISNIVPFSFAFDDDDKLLVANAFKSSISGNPNLGSVNLYNFEDDKKIFSLVENSKIGQTTTCWIRYNSSYIFTSQNVVNSIPF